MGIGGSEGRRRRAALSTLRRECCTSSSATRSSRYGHGEKAQFPVLRGTGQGHRARQAGSAERAGRQGLLKAAEGAWAGAGAAAGGLSVEGRA